MNLEKLQDEVATILATNPASRDDDIDLYLKLVQS